MGKKISLDSATLMNKALEVIEAHYLFDKFPIDHIDVLIHPESIVHGAVLLEDGSILSQVNTPDMHIPIAYALGWPDRICTEYKNQFNVFQNLTFYPPDEQSRFRALFLARQAVNEGKELILNAANEVCTQAFFEKKIPFHQIVICVEEILNRLNFSPPKNLQDILEAHQECELKTREYTNIFS
jgi:1-deoxy-D-xylulose-5-phosphate reductoisomerase